VNSCALHVIEARALAAKKAAAASLQPVPYRVDNAGRQGSALEDGSCRLRLF
jgi:hypothetical protein